MECSVCFESLATGTNGAFSTICGHMFCGCIVDIVRSSGRCPNCNRSLTSAEVFKLYLPRNQTSISHGDSIDGFNSAIVDSLVHDLAEEKKKTIQKFAESQKILDTLSSKFSEVDSKNDKLVAENKMLKETVAGLNAKVARLEEAINGNVDRAKTMPLKEVFKNMKTKTEQM